MYGVKTISLEIDAYEKLCRAKRSARESFSNVGRRARWDDLPPNARTVLDNLRRTVAEHPEVLLAPQVLNALERRKRTVRRTTRWQR